MKSDRPLSPDGRGKESQDEAPRDPADHELLTEAIDALARAIRKDLGERSGGGRVPALSSELRPLIEAVQAEIRGIRRELGLAEPVVGAAPAEPQSGPPPHWPPLPEGVPSPLPNRPEGRAAAGSAPRFGGDASNLRSRWLIASIGGILVAGVVGSWLTGGRRWPTSEVTSSILSSPSEKSIPPQTSIVKPLPVPLPDVPSDSGPIGSVTSSSVVKPRLDESDRLAARASVAPRKDSPGASPSAPIESTSDVGATSAPAMSESLLPAANPADVDARAPEVGLPANPSSGREPVAIPEASPPVAGIEASPAAAANSPSMSLTRPAAVLTSAPPRLLIEVLSGEMSAVVEVVAEVDSAGRPKKVRAVTGPAALRATAEDTVRHWTFSPALQGGVPVDGALRLTLTFGPSIRDMRHGRRTP